MPGGPYPFLTAATIAGRVGRQARLLDGLLQADALSPLQTHELRRRCKKLRAWIRLWRDRGCLKGANGIDKALRAVAAQFSGARDATVRLDTLQRLPQYADAGATVDLQPLSAALQAASDMAMPPSDTSVLRKARKRLQRLLPSTSLAENDERLARGLRATWRKARRLARRAAVTTDCDDLHRLRRWVKYLCYQLEFVAMRNHREVKQLHDALEALGAVLGDYHDLHELQLALQALADTEAGEGDTPLDSALVNADLLCQLGRHQWLQRALQLVAECFDGDYGRFSTS
jgi:CHAD domain-containing protein